MDFIFSMRNCCMKKKIYEIFCFCRQMTNTKLLKGKRLLDMTQYYFLYSFVLRAEALPIYSFIFTLTFAGPPQTLSY